MAAMQVGDNISTPYIPILVGILVIAALLVGIVMLTVRVLRARRRRRP